MHIIALYIFIGILAFISFLLCLRAHLYIVYEDELKIYIRMLFIKYYIFPEKKKKFNIKKHEKKQQKKENAPKTVLKQSNDPTNKSTLLENVNLIKEVISVVLKALPRHAHVKISKMHLKIATSDAANTAILYGVISGVVASIIELIDSYTNLKKLKKCAVMVEPDFVSDKSEIKINISISISTIGALVTLIKTFGRYTLLKHKKVN